ncbi:membrane hypothetical protein [Gammaproteobacteria bacterium]
MTEDLIQADPKRCQSPGTGLRDGQTRFHPAGRHDARQDGFEYEPKSLLRQTSVLVGIYLVLRALFYVFPTLKTLFFIYPVGGLVSAFLGMGDFGHGEWLFMVGTTRVTLGGLCSGTTFFSLLMAYLGMRYQSGGLSAGWLVAGYPLALLTNASRVVCSIQVYAHGGRLMPLAMQEHIHEAIGVVVFATTLIMLTLILERPWHLFSSSHHSPAGEQSS